MSDERPLAYFTRALPPVMAVAARFVFPVVGLAMIYAAHWAGWHLSDVMFVVVLSGAGLATLAVFTGYLVVLEQAPTDQPSRRESASPSPRVWLALSLPMVGAGLIVVLAAELPLFALALFGKNGDAGLYGAAATLTQAFVIIITCQRQIYGPALAGALKQGPKAARRLHAHAQVQAAIFALPVLALMLLAADPLLGLFGPGFADGRHVLWVIATGLAIHTLTALSPRWLDYGGHARLVLITEGVAAGALIVGLVAVTPTFGMIGAATVFAVVVAARSLFLAVAASRWLGLPLVRLGAVDP